MNHQKFTVSDEACSGMRVDRYLSEVEEILTRSQLKTRINRLIINGNEAKLSKKLDAGDVIEVDFHAPEPVTVLPEQIDLEIIYENEDVVVIDKPQGMVVHPAHGNTSGTLVQGLLYHVKGLRQGYDDEEVRPGIVHRLDKDTSGVLITAKHAQAHEFLSRQFRERKVVKVYLAVTRGVPGTSEGRVEKAICRDRVNRKKFRTTDLHGKEARTRYRVMWTRGNYAFLSVYPETGRTHQIRVHLQSMGCPVLGDPLYSRRDRMFPDTNLLLHAYKLKIRLPGREDVSVFRSPLPDRFKVILNRIYQQHQEKGSLL